MGISMRKQNGGKNRIPHIIAFVVAIILALTVVGLLPISFEIKKLLFYVLIIVFAILGVMIPNMLNRRK